MLIYLTAEVASLLQQSPPPPLLVDAVRNLALGEYEGKHVLALSRKLMPQLLAWPHLPKYEEGIFGRLKDQLDTRYSLKKKTPVLVEVSAAASGPIQRHDDGHQLRFVVPFGFFADSQRIQPTSLLGENRNDAKLYKHAAEVYLHQFGLWGDSSKATFHRNLLHVRMTLSGTGGSQLPIELEEAAQIGMALAIADGDIRYPGASPTPDTNHVRAKAVMKQLAGQAVAELLITEGRSVENLLPDATILAHLFPDAPAATRHEQLSDAQQRLLADANARRHLSLKAGLRLWEKFPGNQSGADELRFIADVATKHAPQATNTSDCITACKVASKKQCQCVVIEGLGKDLLANAVAHMEKTPPEEQTLTPDLERIARQVAAFGCAVKPQRRAGGVIYS